MMSECMVPNWKQRHQRQEQVVEGGEENRSSHVHTQIQHHHNQNTVPMPNYEVTELTWKNGQLAMHGLSGLPTGPTKQIWSQASDTLESIVHQATWPNQIPNPPLTQHGRSQNPVNVSSTVGSSIDKRAKTLGQTLGSGLNKKRVRSETDQCGGNLGSSSIQEERSGCGSASAVHCKENDTTMVTWASFESPAPSLKTKTTYEDSACDHDGSENLEDQERETKGEKGRSHSRRRSRAADVHNQSERKRRDRINEKMKALQKLVPNASKTDKASMLDEVIHYLKQLQAQVHLMSCARNMPQMMMPTVLGLHQQQQIQMALLARMGMGMGMGVGLGMGMGLHAPDLPPTPTPTPTFVPSPHPFLMPPMIPNHNQSQATTDAAVGNSLHFNNPYGTFLGQPINMDVYNKMAAIYHQQVNQITQQTSSHLPSATVQGG